MTKSRKEVYRNGRCFSGGGFLLVAVIIVIGTIKSKFKDIYNPINKDNSDYRFIEVENVKTRNIF